MRAVTLQPDQLDTTFVPRFREPVAAVPVAAEAVLYEEDTGNLHRLDAIGAIVCSLFDGQTSVAAAVEELVIAFGAPHATVEADVMALTRELGTKGLLEGVRSEAEDGDDTASELAADAATKDVARAIRGPGDDGC